jgi:hypothetical protein
VELRLPMGVTIANSYGTEFEEKEAIVKFPSLTSIGHDDHQLICLKLKGGSSALQNVASGNVSLSAYSPARKGNLCLNCAVADLSDIDENVLSRPGFADSSDGRLYETLRKAGAVAVAADCLRTAAVAAEKKDWRLAERCVTEAGSALDVFGKKCAEPQICEIRGLIALDREIIQLYRTELQGRESAHVK